MISSWPGLSKARIIEIFANVGLVFFSSTRYAADACEYAYRFYRGAIGLPGGSWLHLIADKGIHFTLFFSLGMILYLAAGGTRLQRLVWVAAICLAVGSLSEVVQSFFPGRDPSVADTILNAASGALAASLASRFAFLIP